MPPNVVLRGGSERDRKTTKDSSESSSRGKAPMGSLGTDSNGYTKEKRRRPKSSSVSYRESRSSRPLLAKQTRGQSSGSEAKYIVTVSGYPKGDWSDEAISSIFSRAGKVMDIRKVNFWNIRYDSEEAANKAVELFDGAVVEVMVDGELKEGRLDVRILKQRQMTKKTYRTSRDSPDSSSE